MIQEGKKTNKSVRKLSVFAAIALAAMSLLQGCALLVLGGVAAGATYGTVKYVNNTLQVSQSVSLDKAWEAANGAVNELKMPITSSAKDGASGKLEAKNSQNQPVVIKLVRKSDTVTQIEVTVGTFDSAGNRTESQQVYDKMKARF